MLFRAVVIHRPACILCGMIASKLFVGKPLAAILRVDKGGRFGYRFQRFHAIRAELVINSCRAGGRSRGFSGSSPAPAAGLLTSQRRRSAGRQRNGQPWPPPPRTATFSFPRGHDSVGRPHQPPVRLPRERHPASSPATRYGFRAACARLRRRPTLRETPHFHPPGGRQRSCPPVPTSALGL